MDMIHDCEWIQMLIMLIYSWLLKINKGWIWFMIVNESNVDNVNILMVTKD